MKKKNAFLALSAAALAAITIAGCYDPESTGPRPDPANDAGIVPTSDGATPNPCESDSRYGDHDGDHWCALGHDLNVDGDCCDSGEAVPVDEGDCQELNPDVHPGRPEVCHNEIDEDCDGLVDDADPYCALSECTEDAACATGDFCIVNVRCTDHRCIAGTARDCSDGDATTADSCNEAADRCDHTPLPSCTSDGACSDGLFCNGTERCLSGSCVAGTTVSCDDGNPRTSDTCNEAGDTCNHVTVAECITAAECSDGLFCNGAERCDGLSGTCRSGSAPSCDDGLSTTTDSCNEAGDTCNHVTIAGCTSDAACSNGLYCDGAERCSGGSCVSGTAPSCDDSDSRTADSCNEASDVCNHTTIVECTALATRSCTTSCGGASGTHVCQADGRWPTSCPPPAELCTNAVDDDCDGVVDDGCMRFYRDADGDTYGAPTGSVSAMSAPPGYVGRDGDCDDLRAAVHPGATDVCPSDGLDNDCVGGDYTLCGVSCTMTDFVTVRVGSPGSSGYRISYNMEDRTCSREYRYVDDSSGVIETIRESRDGLYMVQIQQSSSGQWFSHMETTTPFSPIFLRTGWAVSISVNSATCTFPSIPSGGYTPPTTIAPGACEPCYDSSGWPNVCINTSSSTRELRCNDGVDNDADGRSDAADEDCGRWS